MIRYRTTDETTGFTHSTRTIGHFSSDRGNVFCVQLQKKIRPRLPPLGAAVLPWLQYAPTDRYVRLPDALCVRELLLVGLLRSLQERETLAGAAGWRGGWSPAW